MAIGLPSKERLSKGFEGFIVSKLARKKLFMGKFNKIF